MGSVQAISQAAPETVDNVLRLLIRIAPAQPDDVAGVVVFVYMGSFAVSHQWMLANANAGRKVIKIMSRSRTQGSA